MPTIQVEAHLSRRDLLRAAEQLDPTEFQQFVTDVLGLRAAARLPTCRLRKASCCCSSTVPCRRSCNGVTAI